MSRIYNPRIKALEAMQASTTVTDRRKHWADYKKLAGIPEKETGRRKRPEPSPAASWDSGPSEFLCSCGRTFRTEQARGLHFSWVQKRGRHG